MKSLFEDAIARNLSSGVLYLFLILLLGREVEWVYLASNILLAVLAILLVGRSVLLLCGRVEPKQGAGPRKSGVDWVFPGYALVYALVLGQQGFVQAAWAFLALAAVSAIAVSIVVIRSKRD